MKRALQIAMMFGVLAAMASAVWADGMIVPIRDEIRVRGNWAVKYHRVEMIVRDQVAAVTIDQEFVNTGSAMMEVEYLFPVPPNAAIDAMTMMVGDQEFKGRLLPAEEARKIYEDIVRRKKDPALLEYVGYGLYRTKAFPLEPNKPVKVLVHYTQLCPMDHDVVQVFYPLNTEKFSAKSIDEVSVRVDIKTGADITTVYSPTHEVKCDRKDARQVVATYRVQGAIPNTDFLLYYKAKDEKVGANLLSYQPDGTKDGYFMILASPNPEVAKDFVIPKDIVLVIDRSGSMSSDNKIRQARESLDFILRNLNSEDRFSLISYNDGVDVHFPQLMAANKENLAKAQDVAGRIEAMGGTNLHEALGEAMKLVEGKRDGRPAYVIFLTDGLPTVGNTNEGEIVDHTTKANTSAARIFVLGVGYDVNVKLLDKLAEQNHGVSDYVKPNEPLEAKVSGLYTKVKNPVMTDLKLSVQGVTLRDIYPRTLGDLFDGQQMVIVGRFDCGDATKLSNRQATLVITGMFQGKERGFEYPVSFRPAGRSSMDSYVERLWAVRRVGYLLDEVQLRGKNQELVDEIVRLSRDYGIMTPYTSFLADEGVKLADAPAVRYKAAQTLGALEGRDSGARATMDADTRQAMKSADRVATPAPSAAPGGASNYAEPQSEEAGRGGASGPVDEAAKREGEKKAGEAYYYHGATGWGTASQGHYEKDTKEVYATVRTVGTVTLYRRGDTWMTPEASKLDLEKDADKIKTIERYSDEYFALSKDNTQSENQVLSMQAENEKLLIVLRGQAYLIK